MNRFKGMPSWAGARQKNVLSGVFRLPVSIQFTERHSLRCLGYRPGLTPDRGAFCRAFRGFPYPFSRQMSVLSGIPDTVLGVRPTEERSVWYFVVFGFHSVDRLVFSRVFRIPSWAYARLKSLLSGILQFPVFIQSTNRHSLECLRYHPGRSPDKRAKQSKKKLLLRPSWPQQELFSIALDKQIQICIHRIADVGRYTAEVDAFDDFFFFDAHDVH